MARLMNRVVVAFSWAALMCIGLSMHVTAKDLSGADGQLKLTSAEVDHVAGQYSREGVVIDFESQITDDRVELQIGSAANGPLVKVISGPTTYEIQLMGDRLRFFGQHENGSAIDEPTVQGDDSITEEFLQSPEYRTLPYLSRALGLQGIGANTHAASAQIHSMAMASAKINGFTFPKNVSPLPKRFGDKADSGQCLDQRTAGCDDDCFGMCGPICDCWLWVCGDCCIWPQCLVHDQACEDWDCNRSWVGFSLCYIGAPSVPAAPCGGPLQPINKCVDGRICTKPDSTTDSEAGSRLFSVNFSGKAQWPTDLNGDGRADFLYSQSGSDDYRMMLGTQGLALENDTLAGTRQDDVNYDGRAQWPADVNGDGRMDLLYNAYNGSDEKTSGDYRVMLASSNGTFAGDQYAGSLKSGHAVSNDGDSQWPADVNGDGLTDLLYNKKGSNEYWVMLAKFNGTFHDDKKAGERDKSVGNNGSAQWPADVNGDGLTDLLYNHHGSDDYYVMLAKSDGKFQGDKKAGRRSHNVGYSANAQWPADINGDGLTDFIYNRSGTSDYWVMFAKSDGTFGDDMYAGSRYNDNGVGFGGKAQWPVDVDGDGRADFLYNKDNSSEYWVMFANTNTSLLPGQTNVFLPAIRSANLSHTVGYSGDAQWPVATPSGIAALLYNSKGTSEYWSTPLGLDVDRTGADSRESGVLLRNSAASGNRCR